MVVTKWEQVPVMVDVYYICENLVKCTPQAIYKQIKDGKLPAVKIGGLYRINKTDLMAYCGVKES